MHILGISTGHDAGAAILRDGEVVAAVSEERFTGIKHHGWFPPLNSITFCLKAAGISPQDLDYVAMTSSDLSSELKVIFNISASTQTMVHTMFPRERSLMHEARSFVRRIGRALLSGTGLYRAPHTPETLPLHIKTFKMGQTKLVLVDHHLAHASSAYHTSGIRGKSLIVTSDGIGENISLSVSLGKDGEITPLMGVGEEGSLGYFYGTVTEGLGWWVGNGEGKTMGLAAYGNPDNVPDESLMKISPVYDDGRLVKGHGYGIGETELGGSSTWKIGSCTYTHFPDSLYVQQLIEKYGREDVAAKAQTLLENNMLEVVTSWMESENVKNVAAAGGVFLNCKMNQRIRETSRPKDYHIFPHAGDGGLPLGAALYVSRQLGQGIGEKMEHAYWGPGYSDDEIKALLENRRLSYVYHEDIGGVCGELIAQGSIIGWFNGRMEFGPRALGARSILIDPRKAENKDVINYRVKYRDPWRPFAPSMLYEDIGGYLKNPGEAPYMIVSFDVLEAKLSEVPAVVHVDGTTRPQTVKRDINPEYYALIRSFKGETGVPLVLNTSFNKKGDPIVCTPNNAIQCFYDTGMDYLALSHYLIKK